MNYVRKQTIGLPLIDQNANVRSDTGIFGFLILLFAFFSFIELRHVTSSSFVLDDVMRLARARCSVAGIGD